MTGCNCPACRGRLAKWDTTPAGWTDASAKSSRLPELPQHLIDQLTTSPAQQCKPEAITVADGVFLWVESIAAGHSFLSIHSNGKATVYTYGRYGDIGQGNPMVGEGVLLRMSDNWASRDYLGEQLYRMQARVFKVLDADKILIDGYLSGIYTDSGKTSINPRGTMTRQFGKVIDQYDLTGNNCTTHSVKAIRFGGSRIFDRNLIGFTYSEDFTIPGSLMRYMQKVSGDVADMRAIEVTEQMKGWVPNAKGWAPGQESLEEQAMESSAGTAGHAGSSTGYAGGTFGGSLGGMYEPKNR